VLTRGIKPHKKIAVNAKNNKGAQIMEIEKNVVVGVQMPETMKDLLTQQAQDEGRTLSGHIRYLLQRLVTETK
jgi:hypothetical protein